MTVLRYLHKSVYLMIIMLPALILLSGCASSRNSAREDIEYGNPYYRNMKELPANKIAAETIRDLPDEKLPKMTSDEYERLGDALVGKGEFYLAFLQYEKSLQLNPDNIRVQYKKGITFLSADNPVEAIKEFQAVIDRDPGYAPVYEGMGQAYFQMKRYDQAQNFFIKAVSLDPTLWKSHNFSGNIHDFNGEYEKSISSYLSAITLKPDQGFLYNNLGVSYSMSGNPNEAVKAFYMAINMHYAERKVYNNLGLSLCQLGRYQEGLDAFRKAGSDAQAYNNLGCIYLEQGKLKKASACFEKAIEIDPVFYVKAGKNLEKSRMGQAD